MAIENSVSYEFDLRSSIVLAFSIAAYPVCILERSLSHKLQLFKTCMHSSRTTKEHIIAWIIEHVPKV